METKRKVRKDFDLSKEYNVDVSKCSKEEKKEVQQAFFDVGILWEFNGSEYQHFDGVQYYNTRGAWKVDKYCMYWNDTTEGCNMTAKEFLDLVYEPEQQGHIHDELMAGCMDMKEINEEIKLTLNLMQTDIYEGALNELQYHLACLLEMKRDRLASDHAEEIDYKAKPLTTEELKADNWLCTDVSKECANALKSKNLRVFNSDEWGCDGLWVGCVMDACGDVKRKGLFFDFTGKKQINRIGNDFYWGEK